MATDWRRPTDTDGWDAWRRYVDDLHDKQHKAEITMHVCGGTQAERCTDGGEHDMTAWKRWPDGGTRACRKCGATAMDIDLLRLP